MIARRAKDAARCPPGRRFQARVDALEAELAALKEVVAPLSQQRVAARKDSSTSSKPPSSDLVTPPKPPPPPGQGRSQAGGQPGHPQHERAASLPESVTGGSFDHRLESGPSGRPDPPPAPTLAPRGVQQVDSRAVPLSIEEHRCPPGWCPRRPKRDEAPLPPGIKRGGPVGPSLTPGIASLKGACHASFRTGRTSLRDVVWGRTIARGELARIIGTVSQAWDRPSEGLREGQPVPVVQDRPDPQG